MAMKDDGDQVMEQVSEEQVRARFGWCPSVSKKLALRASKVPNLFAAGVILGLSHEGARLALLAHGFSTKHKKRTFPRVLLRRASRAPSMVEAARILGVSRDVAKDALARAGLTVKRKKTTREHARFAEVCEGYRNGEFGEHEAAKRLGVTRGAVRFAFAKSGVSPRAKHMTLWRPGK